MEHPDEERASCAWRDRLVPDLANRGVTADFSERLRRRLDALPERISPAHYDAIVSAAVVAYQIQQGDAAALERRVELSELERLLPLLAGELRKLDEALKLLNAVLQRLSETRAAKRVIH